MLRFANSYGSHMVLAKAPRRALLWGYAAPGAKVSVAVNNGTHVTASAVAAVTRGDAGADVWSVQLPAMEATSRAVAVVATDATSGQRATLEDVLVGDVVLCSGQSNSEWSEALRDPRGLA